MQELFQNFVDNLRAFDVFSVIDIILVSMLYFAILIFLRNQKLPRVIRFVIVFGMLIAIVAAFSVKLMLSGMIASAILASSLVIFTVIFKSELRRSLVSLGNPGKDISYTSVTYNDDELHDSVVELVKACTTLAKNNVGALIILSKNNMPQHILNSGTILKSVLSAPLLECLFNTKAPLHDGAVVVDGNKIIAAGCFLPLSQSTSIAKDLGTRHRAGIGITESAEVMTIIVSEETGVISVAKNGKLLRYFDSSMLLETLEQYYGLKAVDPRHRHRRRD